jgi:hypothetical protein
MPYGPRLPAGVDAPYGVRTPRGTDATCHFRRAFRSRLYRRRWAFSPTVIAPLQLQILSISFSEEIPTDFGSLAN